MSSGAADHLARALMVLQSKVVFVSGELLLDDDQEEPLDWRKKRNALHDVVIFLPTSHLAVCVQCAVLLRYMLIESYVLVNVRLRYRAALQ